MQTTVVIKSQRLSGMVYISDMGYLIFMRLLNYSIKVSACFLCQDFPFGFYENLHPSGCIFIKNLAFKKTGLIFLATE